MIKTCTPPYLADGTAAVKCDYDVSAREGAHIISFPQMPQENEKRLAAPLEVLLSRCKAKAIAVAASSEMFCSLAYEDFRGCAYNLFSKRNVAVLSASTSALAVLSLIASCIP